MTDWLVALRRALILIYYKGELRHQNDFALERVPLGYAKWQTAARYADDIDRILRELKVAVSFITTLPDQVFLTTHSISPEDYIMYHQGYFLDLVHQLKDKLFRMVFTITEPGTLEKPERIRDLKLGRILSNNLVKRIPSLKESLSEWDQNNPSACFSVVLRTRADYHHNENPLLLSEDYIDTQTHQMFLAPQMAAQLSDYGKNFFATKGQESLQAWQKETLRKVNETMGLLTHNVQTISECLVRYFGYQKQIKRANQLLNAYVKTDERITAKPSKRTAADIHPSLSGLQTLLVNGLTALVQDDLVAVYFTGSMLRENDYLPGLSDFNPVVIINDAALEVQSNPLTDQIRRLGGVGVVVTSRGKFLSEESSKLRFICKTDGFLAYGEDLLKREKDNKIGYDLCWTLNSDYRSYLQTLKELIVGGTPVSPGRLAFLTRELAKRSLRLMFCQVMGNEQQYTASLARMRELLNHYYPANRGFVNKIYTLITRRLVVERDGLLALIEKCEENLLPLYEKIDGVVNLPAKPKKTSREAS